MKTTVHLSVFRSLRGKKSFCAKDTFSFKDRRIWYGDFSGPLITWDLPVLVVSISCPLWSTGQPVSVTLRCRV